jgi:hypothetical protein
MNIFLLSPGRTATTTLSEAFSNVPGFTSDHESKVQELGDARVNYPDFHFECDNRLTWFMTRLTKKYSDTGVLVVVKRNELEIAKSYNKRWYKINIMKSYSQGIHLRPFSKNDLEVCKDYVQYVYEELDFYSKMWKTVIVLDLGSPDEGVKKILRHINREEHSKEVLNYFNNNQSNQNSSGWRHKLSILKFNLENLIRDLFQ